MYMFTHTHTRVHAGTRTRKRTRTHVHKPTRTKHIHARNPQYLARATRDARQILYLYMHIHVYVHTYIHTHVHAYALSHTRRYIYILHIHIRLPEKAPSPGKGAKWSRKTLVPQKGVASPKNEMYTRFLGIPPTVRDWCCLYTHTYIHTCIHACKHTYMLKHTYVRANKQTTFCKTQVSYCRKKYYGICSVGYDLVMASSAGRWREGGLRKGKKK